MIGNNRVIAVVPARAGSKSVPDKNIKPLAGIPLIGRSIAVAKKSKLIDRVIVSTDGKKIADVARSFDAEVYDRDESLAGDKSLVIDCLRDLISRLRHEGESAKYLVLLEPTSPLRNVDDVDNCIELVQKFDAVATFCEAELNPHRAWKISGEKVDTFISGAVPWLPRQMQPEAYQLNGAVYVFEIDKLPDTGSSIFFGNTGAVKMPKERSVDIDTLVDFKFAEFLIEEQQ